MATKPKTQIMSHDDTVMSPITKASNVLFEDGKTAQDKLEDNVEKSFTPSVENSSSMFKVGQGDNVDYSGNVVDGAYVSCVLKGRSLVNCIQEPSSQDVILPYEFTEGQYVTINDTKESGALGVELKGQTLVNLVDKIQHAWGGTGLTLTRDSGYTELSVTETALWYQTSVKHTGLIKLSTTYLAILEVVENTLATPFTLTGNANDGKFLMVNNIVRAGQTGIFKIKLNSKPTFDTSGANRFDLFMQFGKNESVGNKIKLRLMLIEYQEGMENWDIPYFEGMTSVKAPTVKTVGKNLFDYTLELGHITPGAVLENSTTNSRTKDFIKVLPNKTYHSIKMENDQITTGIRFYDSNKKHISSMSLGAQLQGGFTTPANCEYIKFVRINSTNLNAKYMFGYDRFETNTPYESYTSSSLTLPEEVVLRSLPNGVCDTYNTRTGEYVQRIGETTIEELSRFTSFSSYAWGSIQSHGAFQLYNIAKHIDVECSDQWMQTQNMWSDNYVWANAWHGGSMSNPNPNDNLPNVFLAFSNDGHLRLMVRKTLIKPDSPQDVTANDIMDWGRQNVILSTRIQYQLKTPIITKVDPKSVLKPHNTKTHIYTEIPQNSLYPILSHSNPTYPVILKPSTKYSIVANSYSNGHTNSPINFNLGGATASTTVGNRVTMVTTPSTLSNELLTMSGRGNKLNHVMVIEGDVVGDEPYFEGICDVKSPVVKNVGKNLFDLNGEWVKCVYAYGVPQVLLSHSGTMAISNNGFSITTQVNDYNRGFGQYINVSSLDTLYVKATAIYTDTKTVPELKIIGLYENESIPSSVNSTNSSDFKVITKQLGSEQEVSFDLDVSSYSKIFIMFSGGWKSGMSGSYTFTMKDVYIGSSNQTYEPYKSNTTTFNQKDGKTIVLRSLPSGVCDTLNVETGEYVRRIGEVVITNTTPKNIAVLDNNIRVNIALSSLSANTGTTVANNTISDKFYWSETNAKDVEGLRVNGNTLHWCVSKNKLNSHDLQGVNAYLQANPITIQYELATPIITTIDVQGFPYAYTNGHVQLSSSHSGQSLTPKIEYSLPINRNGQIRMNQAMVERHQKHIDKLQAIIITNMVNTQYRQSLTKINYQLGGE